jgi:hypothetical protein
MQDQSIQVPKSILLLFRIIFFICAIYFFLLGMMMIIFPELVTKNAGEQHPLVLGILRGSGGAVIISTIFYVLIAMKPFERRWVAFIIAFANLLAIVLDFISVLLGEYTLSHAMIDIPIETLSFLIIIIFYSIFKTKNIQINN